MIEGNDERNGGLPGDEWAALSDSVAAPAEAEFVQPPYDPDPPPCDDGGAELPPAIANSCPPPPAPLQTWIDWEEWARGCQLELTRRSADGWVRVHMDYSEGGPESFELVVTSRGEQQSVMRGGPFPSHLRCLAAVLSGLPGDTPPNLASNPTTSTFSLNTYPGSVELSGPFQGARLSVEFRLVGTRGQARLTLTRGDATLHLGTLEVGATACPEVSEPVCFLDEDDCSLARLQEAGELCPQPFSLNAVYYAGGELAIAATRQVAGHGGYPPEWHVVPLSRRVRARINAW